MVFGFGNPSRGDDAVGPLLVEALQQQMPSEQTEFLTDFQLQIEHALDLQQRRLVLFVDAAVDCPAGFSFSRLWPKPDRSYSSHALSPAALLYAYQTVILQAPPPSYLLGIAASEFELGAELTITTRTSLAAAGRFAKRLLATLELTYWEGMQSQVCEYQPASG